jgi:hypothetical protein
MLDEFQQSSGSNRPTWEDIKATIQYHIESFCRNCNNAVRHEKHFISTDKDVKEILALAGNKIIQTLINHIIAELIATDPFDICFKQFIKKLKLLANNYGHSSFST